LRQKTVKGLYGVFLSLPLYRHRKEMPTGERYLVTVEIITDENDMPIKIKDTIIRKLDDQ